MKIIYSIISIFICEAVGFLGSVFTSPAIPDWYANLKKPSFSPPNWLFAPVWFFLYALIGMAVSLVWTAGIEKKNVKIALALFISQLILNLFWSFIFFTKQSPFCALIEIIILWILILLTIISFLKISKPAGWLLFPYLAWVSFAAFLNFSIVRLN
jgi:benzodiazapine receptor